jgi:hypothetical protein
VVKATCISEPFGMKLAFRRVRAARMNQRGCAVRRTASAAGSRLHRAGSIHCSPEFAGARRSTNTPNESKIARYGTLRSPDAARHAVMRCRAGGHGDGA